MTMGDRLLNKALLLLYKCNCMTLTMNALMLKSRCSNGVLESSAALEFFLRFTMCLVVSLGLPPGQKQTPSKPRAGLTAFWQSQRCSGRESATRCPRHRWGPRQTSHRRRPAGRGRSTRGRPGADKAGEIKALHLRAQGEIQLREALQELRTWGNECCFQTFLRPRPAGPYGWGVCVWALFSALFPCHSCVCGIIRLLF